MAWFRKNLQVGSHVALLALAIQLVLSSSHVHLGGFRQGHGYSTSIEDEHRGGNVLKSPVGPCDLSCAICISIQLAGTLVHPVPPALEFPHPLEWTLPEGSNAPLVTTAPYLAFVARAPPPERRRV
jgi:hypothetical protein